MDEDRGLTQEQAGEEADGRPSESRFHGVLSGKRAGRVRLEETRALPEVLLQLFIQLY